MKCKTKMKKTHILEDNVWHNYAWVYDNGKTRLFVDGQFYKGKEGITLDYWFKNNPNFVLRFLDEMRMSSVARKKIR